MSRNPPKVDDWNELGSPCRTSAARVLGREIHRHYPHLVGHPTVKAGLATFDSLPFRVFGSGALGTVLRSEETLLSCLQILAALGEGPFNTRTALARALVKAFARERNSTIAFAAYSLAQITEQCRVLNWALYPAIIAIGHTRRAQRESERWHEEEYRRRIRRWGDQSSAG